MEFKSDVVDMDLDEDRWLWVTVGVDKIVKVCLCACLGRCESLTYNHTKMGWKD